MVFSFVSFDFQCFNYANLHNFIRCVRRKKKLEYFNFRQDTVYAILTPSHFMEVF
jgi:hypothetical protein